MTSSKAILPAGVGFWLWRVAAAAITSLVPLFWLIMQPGWPDNHEGLRIFRRMGIFGEQWRLGHLLPVWSTSAFHGFGSASPIMYHKTFNILSTLIVTVTGAPKAAACLSIIILMVVLCLGVGCACRIMLDRKDLVIEAAAAMLAVFSTYVTTDWLTRGAMAEFCALAGVAWLFAWCMLILKRGIFSLWLGPLMAAICLSHAAIGLFCLIPIAIFIVAAGMLWPRNINGWMVRAVACLAIALALLSPVLVAVYAMSGSANMALLGGGLGTRPNEFAFTRLFFEPVWHWGDTPMAISLQIDPLLLVLAVLLPFACVSVPQTGSLLSKSGRATALCLLAVIFLTVGLQSDIALWFYRSVPFASYLQFTFRLLAFDVIAMALCGALMFDIVRQIAGPRATLALACACAAGMSFGKPWLGYHPSVLRYTAEQIRQALASEAFAPEPLEYIPRPISYNSAFVLGDKISDRSIPCLGHARDDTTHERAETRFDVRCDPGGTVVLPIAFSPAMRFRVGDKPAAAFRACPDARARLAATGDMTVTVAFPSWWDAVAAVIAPLPACGDRSA